MPPREMKGGVQLDDKEFMSLMEDFAQYLETEKVFIKNPARLAEVQHATEIAKQLFLDSKVSLEDDPLQMGALILRIEGFDVVIRGEREINLFKELISKADNFEIYPLGDERMRFSMVFSGALIRLPQGK